MHPKSKFKPKERLINLGVLHKKEGCTHCTSSFCLAVRTRLELATPCVTGMYSNQTELPDHACFCECKSTTFFFHSVKK